MDDFKLINRLFGEMPEERRDFMAGFWSVYLYMGAFACLAPLWMKDWDRPMREMLERPRP